AAEFFQREDETLSNCVHVADGTQRFFYRPRALRSLGLRRARWLSDIAGLVFQVPAIQCYRSLAATLIQETGKRIGYLADAGSAIGRRQHHHIAAVPCVSRGGYDSE